MLLRCSFTYILKLENTILTSTKLFWNYIKQLKSNRSPISENMSFKNVTASSFKESTQLFA